MSGPVAVPREWQELLADSPDGPMSPALAQPPFLCPSVDRPLSLLAGISANCLARHVWLKSDAERIVSVFN